METQLQESPQKPRRRLRLLLIVPLVAVVVLAVLLIKKRADHVPPAFEGNSSALTGSVIIHTLDTPLPAEKTGIWCSSFQLAWNHMRDDVVKGPIKLKDAQPIADRLNQGKESEADYAPGSCYAAAGTVDQGIVERIQREMRAFTHGRYVPEISVMSPTDLVSYAYVNASVPFKRHFINNNKPLIFTDSRGRETKVRSFGLRSADAHKLSDLRRQVNILYQSETEFIIDPCATSEPNQILLALVAPGKTMAETLASVQSKISSAKAEPFSESAILFIPNIRYRVTHHFTDLEGKDLLNPKFTGYFVYLAQQDIDFRFDKTGAKLESEARMQAGEAVAPAIQREAFIFNRPFLLIMQKRGAKQPFFVMWVDSAELLCKSE
ncbi:MAG: hypothetical protein ACYC6A_16610 [Armatimonadota bacterium]